VLLAILGLSPVRTAVHVAAMLLPKERADSPGTKIRHTKLPRLGQNDRVGQHNRIGIDSALDVAQDVVLPAGKRDKKSDFAPVRSKQCVNKWVSSKSGAAPPVGKA
jgi:hypothetical protein